MSSYVKEEGSSIALIRKKWMDGESLAWIEEETVNIYSQIYLFYTLAKK